MNYESIKSMATAGIDFFSDGSGYFDCITQPGRVEIVGGVEVEKPEIKTKIKGLVRAPRAREVDGEAIRVTDKLGVFNADIELKNGYQIDIDGERYVMVETRPIRPTSITVAYRPIMRRISVHG
ncbi:hypothetical protein CSP48_004045 [Salmonella enterica subsp. arizonae]|nr:hypothetical protein [Salmonella enterica subsp. arizonae]